MACACGCLGGGCFGECDDVEQVVFDVAASCHDDADASVHEAFDELRVCGVVDECLGDRVELGAGVEVGWYFDGEVFQRREVVVLLQDVDYAIA